MKAVLVELDDDVAAELERAVPKRSRGRSEFIRQAIRRALWALEEQATAEAYRRQPDQTPAYVAPEAWEARPSTRRPGRRKVR
jgi:predicted transcriptional regulator